MKTRLNILKNTNNCAIFMLRDDKFRTLVAHVSEIYDEGAEIYVALKDLDGDTLIINIKDIFSIKIRK